MTIVTTRELCKRNRRVDHHVGCNHDWLDRHARLCRDAARQSRTAVHAVARSLAGRAAHTNNLLIAWDYVARRSGDAPGPDGMTAGEFPFRAEVCDLLRRVGKEMKEGSYEPGGTKPYPLAKRGGGYRVIHVQDLVDRVVHRAIVQVVQPLVEPTFLRYSFGYRPGRSRFDMLAAVERDVVVGGRNVLVTEDVRGAFDHVPLGRLLAVFEHHLPCERLTALVGRAVMYGKRVKGLLQGSPLSPLLLNLYLHHMVDRRWRPCPGGTLLLRYADNLVVPCATVVEANASRARLAELLRPAGLRLKVAEGGQVGPCDLNEGMSTTLLGFDVKLEGSQLAYGIPAESWNGLYEAAAEIRRRPPPEPEARYGQAVLGWLGAMGPAYPHVRRDTVFEEVFAVGAGAGVQLRPHHDYLKDRWRTAYRRWDRLRRGASPARRQDARSSGSPPA